MAYIPENSDGIPDALAELAQSAGHLSKVCKLLDKSSETLVRNLYKLESELTAPNAAIASVMLAIQQFGISAASRTQDIELVLAETRFPHFAGEFDLTPVHINRDGYEFQAHPKTPMRLGWSRPPLGQARPDCFWAESTWQFSLSDDNPQEIIIKLELTLRVDATTTVGLQRLGIRFYATDYSPADPFLLLPIEDRRKARSGMYDEIADQIDEQTIELPKQGAGSETVSLTPHFFAIRRDLCLVVRSLPKRRLSLPLAGGLYGIYDQLFRLKSDHIIPTILETVQQEGATVTSVVFRPGYIELSARRSESQSFLWISVDVTVDIVYEITILEDLSAYLFVNASWLRWNAHYEAHNCYPVCDDVIDTAKKKTADEIEKYKLLTSLFMDLRADAKKAEVRISPYGLDIVTQGS